MTNEVRDERERAGFDAGCEACRAAARKDREACPEHYVPTHRRKPAGRCPGCRGPLPRDATICGRCKAADVLAMVR